MAIADRWRVLVVAHAYGGLMSPAHECLVRDIIAASRDPSAPEIAHMVADGDALIDRARSIVCETALARGDDVVVMVDHDLSWEPGAIVRLATMARARRAIVGAAISKRSRGNGIASALVDEGVWLPGTDRLVRATYVGSAMTAYPREIVEAVYARTPRPTQGWRPAFAPTTWPHASTDDRVVGRVDLRDAATVDELAKEIASWPRDATVSVHDGVVFASTGPLNSDYLSEDWAFCRRAIEAGYECYLDLMPIVAHHGHYAYTMRDAFHGADARAAQRRPSYSLLHATRGRRGDAIAARNLWLERASGMHQIEYILSVDDDDPSIDGLTWPVGTRVVVGPPRGCVAAYNRAAYASTGDVLIQVHDDTVPPVDWDLAIEAELGDYERRAVVRVSDGLPREVNASQPDLIPIMICTRAYARSIGYLFHPSFESIYCDAHAAEMAAKEGVVVDARERITIEHLWGGPDRDETQRRSYAPERWESGLAALLRERARGLPLEPELWP